ERLESLLQEGTHHDAEFIVGKVSMDGAVSIVGVRIMVDKAYYTWLQHQHLSLRRIQPPPRTEIHLDESYRGYIDRLNTPEILVPHKVADYIMSGFVYDRLARRHAYAGVTERDATEV
ncbi:MAG: hypothetical protein Q9224_000454, partial [Gallowayella concinna]